MAIDFHEIEFPAGIIYGASGGPSWKTIVNITDSGKEQRRQDWEDLMPRYVVAKELLTPVQWKAFIAFFNNRHGRFAGFRLQDLLPGEDEVGDLDNPVEGTANQFGLGDGVKTAFQIVKTYDDGLFTTDRKIHKIVAGTETLFKNTTPITDPTDYSLDDNTGIITMVVAPLGGGGGGDGPGGEDVIKGHAEFRVPVRFEMDFMSGVIAFFDQTNAPDIVMIGLKL